MNQQRIGTEKAKILARHQAYLSERPPIDDALQKMGEGIAELNGLDELSYTYSLTSAAALLDIELQDSPNYWKVVEPFGERALTPTGRNALRKMIDDEKIRRREAKAWWWKTVIIPAITALAGFVGVITGLVAVLRK